MVLRGIQIQRCGPAGCALLTRRAFSHHYPEELEHMHRGMCVVATRPIPFILRSEGQRWDGAVHFTHHDPNRTRHRATRPPHAALVEAERRFACPIASIV
jgi:hypothetical protein